MGHYILYLSNHAPLLFSSLYLQTFGKRFSIYDHMQLNTVGETAQIFVSCGFLSVPGILLLILIWLTRMLYNFQTPH